MRKVVMALGRFQPPTLGHQVMVEQLVETAERYDLIPMVFIVDGAQTGKDKTINPLTAEMRFRMMRRWFPRVRVDIIGSAYDAMDILYLQGLEPEFWLAGTDRARKYQGMLDHAGYQTARTVEIERSSGIAAGVSGTKARQLAGAGDFEGFRAVMPKSASQEELLTVMRLLRLGQGIDEL